MCVGVSHSKHLLTAAVGPKPTSTHPWLHHVQDLRWMGALRLDVYGLWRLVSLRKYRAKLSFLEAATGEWVTLDSSFVGIWGCNVPFMTQKDHVAPSAEFASGSMELMVFHGSMTRWQARASARACDSLSNAIAHQQCHGRLELAPCECCLHNFPLTQQPLAMCRCVPIPVPPGTQCAPGNASWQARGQTRRELPQR